MSDVRVGDWVWAYNEATQRQEFSEVLNVMSRQAEDIVRLDFKEHTMGVGSLRCTGEHPLWVVGKGWTDAKYVNVGDVLLEMDISAWTSQRRRGNPNYRQSEKNKAASSSRMKAANPMKVKEVALRAAASKKASGHRPPMKDLWKTESFRAIVVDRMKNRNPMKDPAISAKSNDRPWGKDSGVEKMAMALINELQLPITRNKGKLNIGRRIPDFSVDGKNKVIEVTHPTFMKRERDGYHLKNSVHYGKHGYECLTVYLHDRMTSKQLYDASMKMMEFAYNGKKVLAKAACKPAKVYNLTTSLSTFFANGVLTHNCDTPYTSHTPEGGHVPVETLVKLALASKCDHVVVTGGEPMLFPVEVAALVGAIRKSKTVTIETNGTLYDPAVCPDLWSASPKLPSSAPLQPSRAQELHLKNYKALAVRQMAASGALLQVKFVATTDEDVEDIKAVIAGQGLSHTQVWLMPEGRTREEMLERGPWAAEVCKREGWNLCLRQHVLLWGNKRGV